MLTMICNPIWGFRKIMMRLEGQNLENGVVEDLKITSCIFVCVLPINDILWSQVESWRISASNLRICQSNLCTVWWRTYGRTRNTTAVSILGILPKQGRMNGDGKFLSLYTWHFCRKSTNENIRSNCKTNSAVFWICATSFWFRSGEIGRFGFVIVYILHVLAASTGLNYTFIILEHSNFGWMPTVKCWASLTSPESTVHASSSLQYKIRRFSFTWFKRLPKRVPTCRIHRKWNGEKS